MEASKGYASASWTEANDLDRRMRSSVSRAASLAAGRRRGALRRSRRSRAKARRSTSACSRKPGRRRSRTIRSSRCRSPPCISTTCSGRRASRSIAPRAFRRRSSSASSPAASTSSSARPRVLRGEPNVDKRPPGYPFDETDLYKVIEGASYSLSVTPDPKLDAYVDGLIAKIAAAQEPDGYIYTTRTIDPKNPHRWAGPERWVFERDDSHELYDLGHLFEAAVAHHLATGKRTLLERRDQGRRSAGRDVRSRQAHDLARPSDHRDGAGEAVSRHRQGGVSQPRQVPARRARPGSAIPKASAPTRAASTTTRRS